MIDAIVRCVLGLVIGGLFDVGLMFTVSDIDAVVLIAVPIVMAGLAVVFGDRFLLSRFLEDIFWTVWGCD